MSTTKKNIIKNGISSFGQKGVRILEQLLLIPFFISHWGVAYYGEWLTLTIIPSVLAFSDLGFGTAAGNSFVLKYIEGKFQEAADILKTAVIIITLVILSGLLLGTAGILLTIHFDWLKHSLISTNDSLFALSFMIIAKVLSFYGQLFDANFRAVRKAHLGINLQTFSGLLNVGVGLLSLLLGCSVVGYAFWQMIVALFYQIIYSFFAYNIIPNIKSYKAHFQKNYVREFVKLGIGYLLSPLWQILLFQGTTLVVRIVLGPVAVAIYSTARTLTRSINQLYNIISGSIFPEIQYEIGQNNVQKAKSILQKAIKITAILALLGFLGMATVGLPVYNWWTKNELDPPYILWLLLILSTVLNAFWWTSETVFRAMNKPYQLNIAGMIFSILTIGITLISCNLWGIVGVGFGSLAFEVGMAGYILPSAFKLLNNNIEMGQRNRQAFE